MPPGKIGKVKKMLNGNKARKDRRLPRSSREARLLARNLKNDRKAKEISMDPPKQNRHGMPTM